MRTAGGLHATDEFSSPLTRGRGPHRRFGGWVRRHWLFLAFFVAGAVLRVITQITYRPAILFFDSYLYLARAVDLDNFPSRPIGYPLLFLRPLLAFDNLALIPAAQHVLGLGMAVVIYAMLARHGVRRWLAALAGAPVLLDGYQLHIEQNVMADTFFQALVVAALALLTWRLRPSLLAVTAAGLLLGFAATVRFVGLPLAVAPFVYLLVISNRWRRRIASAGILALAVALPLLAYSAYTYTESGDFRPGSKGKSGQAFYVRTAPIADCSALADGDAPPYILSMCPDLPPDLRPDDLGYYAFPWAHGPAHTTDYPPGTTRTEAQREFAMRVAVNQPLDVAGAILMDFLRGFAWQRTQYERAWPLENWRFQTEIKSYKNNFTPWQAVQKYGGPEPSVNEDLARFLRDYQSVIYTRGPILAVGIVLPVLALFRRRSSRQPGLRGPALLVAGSAVAVLMVAAVFSFSWRYQLPAIPLLPWSAVLGVAALFPRMLRERKDQQTRPAESRV